MSVITQARPFDPRPVRRPVRQWPLGFAVLVAAVLNAVVWGGLFTVAKTFLNF
ncbi:hypothetical protein [Caulobacter sp. RHG1]|uniref:hypothetical protein n=1 Tax=Caulobacter sp. (strain RHG1) TaxID=2545762 RepID=UPI0015533C9D|nr:hypothetical protein [Caulobacter sp. RHG1]NQE60913.1 hypothetical protein [Caulobacter sp. RHG1]